MADNRLCQGQAAGDNRTQILARRQAKLHVDIGEAEIGVEQQHAAARANQSMRQRDGQPGFTHPALAGGDRDESRRFNGHGVRFRAASAARPGGKG